MVCLTGTHAFINPGSDKGTPYLTMNWDEMVDVPLRQPLERLNPLARTGRGLYPTEANGLNRPNMAPRSCRHLNQIGRGSPTYEHTVLGAKESKCGEVRMSSASKTAFDPFVGFLCRRSNISGPRAIK